MKSLHETVVQAEYPKMQASEKQRMISDMNKAEIIYIQNVADYFYLSEQENWKLEKDFPNLAPPFPSFWMEYTIPQRVYAEGREGVHPYAGMRLGFLFQSMEPQENKHNVKWMTTVDLFSLYENKIYQATNWSLAIDKDGQICHMSDGEAAFVTAMESISEVGRDAAWIILVPALLAVSFLHCKNVDLVPRLPQVGSRKQRSRYAPRIKYHTLQIEPMKKILREEGNAEETGIKHALHICRGHFKDFSKGKGLFGKYKGIFWWESQVRGSGEHGVTIKDYNINAA